jgi:hypothetical protein
VVKELEYTDIKQTLYNEFDFQNQGEPNIPHKNSGTIKEVGGRV